MASSVGLIKTEGSMFKMEIRLSVLFGILVNDPGSPSYSSNLCNLLEMPLKAECLAVHH